MRGKADLLSSTEDRLRITPAYAGKSILMHLLQSGWMDHPRLCGEKISLAAWNAHCTGSPPPMRGKD